MAKKHVFLLKNSRKIRKSNEFQKFFFEIDLQSFKTYFKTKMWISKFFSFGGDGGRHS